MDVKLQGMLGICISYPLERSRLLSLLYINVRFLFPLYQAFIRIRDLRYLELINSIEVCAPQGVVGLVTFNAVVGSDSFNAKHKTIGEILTLMKYVL